MYDIQDLFDRRGVFSSRLEQYMEVQSISKTKLCKDAGISRPTLDKLLNAGITNATNFEKHVQKILRALQLTPDALMGNAQNTYAKMRQLKQALHISEESVAAETGISLSRLREIEAGADATVAELRDIAFCCHTSVRGLLGTQFFDLPVSAMNDVVSRELSDEFSGFWGHIGILTAADSSYLWYPISYCARQIAAGTADQPFLVVPCMNNRVLFLNMARISHLILLDDACDAVPDTDWDPRVSEGEIPLVVYDVLEEYALTVCGDEPDPERISPLFCDLLKQLCEQMHWEEEDLFHLNSEVILHFANGKTFSAMCDFHEDQTLTDAIHCVYDFGELDPMNNIVGFTDRSGAEMILNLNNVSIIDAPLLAVEDAVCQTLEELG